MALCIVVGAAILAGWTGVRHSKDHTIPPKACARLSVVSQRLLLTLAVRDSSPRLSGGKPVAPPLVSHRGHLWCATSQYRGQRRRHDTGELFLNDVRPRACRVGAIVNTCGSSSEMRPPRWWSCRRDVRRG